MRRLIKRKDILLVLLLVFAMSCSHEQDSDFSTGAEGELALKVSGNTSTLTKAVGEDVSEYEIVIYKGGQQYARFLKYADMPNPFKLRAANYDLKAFWGSNPSIDYNAPYYEGQAPFSIVQGEVSTVEVVCYLANTKMSFEVTQDFKDAFSDYSIAVTTPYRDAEHAFVIPKANLGAEGKDVYLRPGDIKLKLNLTKRSNGEKYVYGLPMITDVKPQHHYQVKLNAGPSGTNISVMIDETLTEMKKTIQLSDAYLIKDVPTITPAFNATSPIVLPYRLSSINSIAVLMKAEAGIKDLELTISKPDAVELNVPLNIKFSEMTPELKEKLNSWGIAWSGDVLSAYQSSIRFTNLQNRLNLQPDLSPADYQFSLKVIDIYDNSAVLDPFTIRVEPPRFSMPEVPAGDAWATFAYASVLTADNVSFGDFSKMNFSYEMKKKNEEAWQPVSLASQRYYIPNLESSTEYVIRAKYDEFYSDAVSFTTENIVQLPNSNMQDWSNKHVAGSDSWLNMKIYEWFANSTTTESFWGTQNPLTTSQRDGTVAYYTSYPGTVSTTDSRSGNAARISTVGWGKGNTMVAGGGHIVYNTDKGMLFTGTCDASGNKNFGRSFTSRPTKLTYWYKHLPYNGHSYKAYISVQNRDNGTVELGRAEIVDPAEQSTYRKVELPIEYNTNYGLLKATHIEVVFMTSTAEEAMVRADVQILWGDKGAFGGYADSRTEGSVLYIDDIELIYTK